MDTVVTQEEVNVMTTHITEYCNSLGVDVSPAMQATVTPVDLRTISGEGRGVGQKEGGKKRVFVTHTHTHNSAQQRAHHPCLWIDDVLQVQARLCQAVSRSFSWLSPHASPCLHGNEMTGRMTTMTMTAKMKIAAKMMMMRLVCICLFISFYLLVCLFVQTALCTQKHNEENTGDPNHSGAVLAFVSPFPSSCVTGLP